MAIEGIQLLYVLGVLEALVFCGLGWILTCTSVSVHKCNYAYNNDNITSTTVISMPRIIHVFMQVLHACMNLTTNEMFNYKRYSYLRDKKGRYLNPFSRGPVLNFIEFFLCPPHHQVNDPQNYHILSEDIM